MHRRLLVLLTLLSWALSWILAPTPEPRRGEAGQVAVADSEPGTVVFDLVDGASTALIEQLEAELGIDLEYSSDVSADEALLRADVADRAAVIAAALGHPEVEVVEAEVRMQALGAPNDPLWEQQWNLRRIGVEAGWAAGAGSGVTVAVLDTGVSPVEDLAGTRMAGGRSFVPGVTSWEDDQGHGTHVAGTIAQATNNGLGVAGIAHAATLMPLKVLGAQGGGSADRIAAAVDFAVDEGADVLNLSLGGPHSAVLHKAVQEAVRRGVVVVAAAGNTGRAGVGCPAHAEGVLGVSALGPDHERAPYSTFGPGVEIAAPGGDLRREGGGIVQDMWQPGGHAYRGLQGTSMASPHVAGAAAVLLGTGLDDRAAVDALLRSARDAGPRGWDPHYGHGKLDLEAALVDAGGDHSRVNVLLAVMVALCLGLLASLPSKEIFPLLVAAALFAGGLWLLGNLGLVRFGGSNVLFWPAAISPAAVHNPLWASAALPLLLSLLLAFTRRAWVVAAAVAIAFALGLTRGAAWGSIDPWWLSGLGDRVWLLGNAAICLVLAGAVVGLRGVRR